MSALSFAGTGGGAFSTAELPTVAATSAVAIAATSVSKTAVRLEMRACIETLRDE
jgi:hypothetical protein